jgi:hypothetical protein
MSDRATPRNFLPAKHVLSKVEGVPRKIRISKSETNSEKNQSQIGKIQNTESQRSLFGTLLILVIWIVLHFGFRASNFFVLGVVARVTSCPIPQADIKPGISK